MNKLWILGILALLLTSIVSARIADNNNKIPLPPQPPKEKSYSGSHGWVESIIGNEFSEINLWKFSQHSSKSAKDITGTNGYLYNMKDSIKINQYYHIASNNIGFAGISEITSGTLN